MKLVVGIDEAGLGPKLGPLVIAASRFLVPDCLNARQLYGALRSVVGRAGCSSRRLAIHRLATRRLAIRGLAIRKFAITRSARPG